jgi:hypothetical protein
MEKMFVFTCGSCGFKDEDEDRKRLQYRARQHTLRHEPQSNHRDLAELGITEL